MKKTPVWVWVVAGGFLACALTAVLSVILLFSRAGTLRGDGVGLVEVKGMILDSQEVVKQLRDLGKDGRVKAVVLRVDSPGGIVAPSQEIHDEVKKLAGRKKVVVSMGSLAASGGYYISAPASLIFANPGTITGSIGVLMKLTNVQGLMDKIGLKAFTLKTGEFKDSGSPLRPLTEAEKGVLQSVIDSAHSQFVRAVADGRKIPVDEVRKIADGRVLSGEQAKDLKLVDRLGTLQDAIEEAGRLGGIQGEPQVICPPKKKKLLLDLLVEEAAVRVTQTLRQETGLSAIYEPAAGVW
ncbi:signal peptide peptidase SppA [Geobacter sp. DSM 9736]|uniref:signal peptide peptidase SppA n=1 Tax=Geobacter sp. DSM 9736 TaxID=1277350 RepID=UPI000B5DFEAA|nr:signal peptide peptidase SppA [Geobacter sp. DSM 9736]SNB45780.1 signal peptide peptidase A. Serine peptidase. MEROPS family S49 [Geobacter sp. DSM 9736]